MVPDNRISLSSTDLKFVQQSYSDTQRLAGHAKYVYMRPLTLRPVWSTLNNPAGLPSTPF